MKWPWARQRAVGGSQARDAARVSLAQARAQRPEVVEVSRSLRRLREANHFGDALMASMRRST